MPKGKRNQGKKTPPSKRAASSKISATSSSSDLALSLLQERRSGLEERRQWYLKQIKRKRTELNNFINQIGEVVQEMRQAGQPVMEKMQAIDDEIHELFASILSQPKLGKKSRHKIEQIYLGLQLDGMVSARSPQITEDEDSEFEFEPDPDAPDSAAEEFDREMGAREEARSEGDRLPTDDSPRTQSSKEMRQTFLRLANIFHPDRAEEGEEERNTAIMQEINRAYKDGDFARLLELERQHRERQLSPESTNTNDTDRDCQRLEAEIEALAEQYERLKAELRWLRNDTQEGELVTEYRRAAKEGFNLVEELIKEWEVGANKMAMLRDFIKDFREKKITLKEFLAGPNPGGMTVEEIMAALAEEGFPVPTDLR